MFLLGLDLHRFVSFRLTLSSVLVVVGVSVALASRFARRVLTTGVVTPPVASSTSLASIRN
jgi:hypothetical protein